MTPIDSKTLYTTIQRALSQAKERISLETDQDVSITIYYWPSNKGDLEIQFSNNRYGNEKVEFSGRDIQDMTEEFIRRCRFANGQSNKLLGAPTVENGDG